MSGARDGADQAREFELRARPAHLRATPNAAPDRPRVGGDREQRQLQRFELLAAPIELEQPAAECSAHMLRHTRCMQRTRSLCGARFKLEAGCFAHSKTASMRYFRRAKALPRRQTGDQWLRIRRLKDGHDVPATWSRFEPCDKQRTWRISAEQHPPGVGSCRSLSRATHQPWHPSELAKK